MKKYFVVILSAAIAFGSCACGGEATDKTEEKESTKAEESVPHRTGDEIVGVSDKNISDLDVTFTDTVRDDTTGNWRLAMASTSEDFLSHFFINTTLGTTASISKMADMLCITIYEHVDGEEHSANNLPEGMSLGQYWIYLDNGDIEKIG